MSPNENAGEAKPEAGASLYSSASPTEEQKKRPYFCLFRNYANIVFDYYYLVKRTYEEPSKWYFLTFKPFNETYKKYYKWYQKSGLDHCRKKIGKVNLYFLTRETDAEKTHINALVCSDRDLTELHEKKTNKYFIYAVNVPQLPDREKVFEYIFKESKSRYFNKNIDFSIYSQT